MMAKKPSTEEMTALFTAARLVAEPIFLLRDEVKKLGEEIKKSRELQMPIEGRE